MDQKKLEGLPRSSLVYLGVCGAVVLFFCIFGLYSSRKALTLQDMAIAHEEAKIKEQQILQPVYLSLVSKLKETGPEALRSVPKVGMPVDQLGSIPNLFGSLSSKCQLDAVQANPEAKSITADSRFVPVRVIVRGELENLRTFLIQVLELSFVEHVEELQLHEAAGAKELKLKVWLTVEDGKKANG